MKTLLSILLVSSLLVSCASYTTTAGKLLTSTAVTVETARQSWVKYVEIHGITQQQDEKARAVYRQYQEAMVLAQSAYASLMKTGDKIAWNDASKSLQAASTYLLAIISTNNLVNGGSKP